MTDLVWRAALSTAEQEAVRALVADAEHADAVAPIGEQVIRDLAASDGAHLLAVGSDGAVVGYLNLTPQGVAELAVLPAARRRGVGAALVAAARERSHTPVRIWAHGTLPGAAALAAKLRLRPVRELIQMRRPVGAVPESAAPPGMSIRRYEGSHDDPELLRVNNAAFSWHPEQGGWTDEHLGARFAEPWFDPAGLFLAFDETGAMRGFHWTKVHHDRLGEVYVLGVDPAAQGSGLGKALTAAGLKHLHQRLGQAGGESAGEAAVILYAESDNVAAVRTYEALGFRRSNVDTVYSAD